MYVIDGTTLYMPEDSSMQMTTNVETQPTTSAPNTNEPAEKSTSQETSVDHTASEASPAEVTPDNKSSEESTERGEDASSSVPPVTSDQPVEQTNAESEKQEEEPEKTLDENILPEVTSAEIDVENRSEETEDTGSVYEYLSDTLTGWMSGDGGDNEEEDEEDYEDDSKDEEDTVDESKEIASDTGQEQVPVPLSTTVNIQQESSISEELPADSKPDDKPDNIDLTVEEIVTQEPQVLQNIEENTVTESSMTPETVVQNEQPLPMPPDQNIDLPQINLLSLKPHTVMPPKQIHKKEVETLDSETVATKETEDKESSNLIDEIDVQGTVYPPSAPVPAFSYLSSSGKYPSMETQGDIDVNNNLKESEVVQPEEIVADVGKEEEGTSETESVTPPSVEDLMPPDVQTTQGTTEEESSTSTPSPIFYEPSPTELPSQEESEAPKTQEDLSTGDEVNISDTKETTTSHVKIEGTFEEITTPAPPVIVEETEPEEESSGGLFASWVYTLFGYGSTEDESSDDGTTTTEEADNPEVISTDVTEEPPTTSWWSWGSSDSSEEQIISKQSKLCSVLLFLFYIVSF